MKRFSQLYSLALAILVVSMSACTTQLVNPEFGTLPKGLTDSLIAIGPAVQAQEIDPTVDVVIKGENGTRLFVAANSLLDENGAPITKPVKMEFKENYTMADFVLSNLQTVHNGEILQTQGMIYFDAKTQDGGTVTIDPTKPIRIELPLDTTVADAKIFTGQRETDGQINWNEINEPSKTLVPFPIASIIKPNGDGCWYWLTRWAEIENEDYWDNWYFMWEETYLWSWKKHQPFKLDSLANYENTLVATREFAERYNTLCAPGLLPLYIANLDKNMWELDEITIGVLKKDSAQFLATMESNWPKGYYWYAESLKKEDAIKHWQNFWHNAISDFRDFAAQKLTTVDPNRKIADTTLAQINAAYIAYDALEFGWVNVDYFYRDPLAEKIKLSAQTNMDAHIINLIFPEQNIILSGIKDGSNKYVFTKNDDGYNKLPRGEKAILLALGYEGEKLYFTKKEITIGANEVEILELKLTNGYNIQQELSALNKKAVKPKDEGEEGAL